MFQDVGPHILDAQYVLKEIEPTDYVIILRRGELLTITEDELYRTPTYSELNADYEIELEQPVHLITVEGRGFFFADIDLNEQGHFKFQKLDVLRQIRPRGLAFAAATGAHLGNWYRQNRFCGHCGHQMELGNGERKLVCPACGLQVFPKILPAIIVGGKNDNQLLLTKYSASYNHYALIAGFVEIGETLEDAIRREVYEETGLEVENIHYYKSQPWAFSQSVLVGFFADLAPKDTYPTSEYKNDDGELALAKWFTRDKIPHDERREDSLTWTMIEAFRNGENA